MRLGDQADLDRALALLAQQDPAIAQAVALAGPPALRRRDPGFAGMVAIFAAQQLSVAAARSILAKLEAGLGSLSVEAFAGADVERLRGLGLSRPKARSLKALAETLIAGHVDLTAVSEDPEAAKAALVALPGVGPWTAEIYLLFCLGHADILPAGDLALQYAAQHLLDLEGRPSDKTLREIGERWAPYRGVAAHVLWTYYGALKAGRSGAPA